jgi:hypothetical protein
MDPAFRENVGSGLKENGRDMDILVDELYQIQKTENMSSQNPGPEREKPARCIRIEKRGASKKGRERMSLKIEKNASRGNRTEFGDERSFIAQRISSPIFWFDLKKSG